MLLGWSSVFLALADHSGTAQTKTPVLLSNNTGGDSAHVQLPFIFSSASLVDASFGDSTLLDSEVLEGTTHEAYMPGTGRTQVLACFDNAAANETTDCNDAGADDFALPAANTEVFEFAFDSQAKHLWLNIGTAAVATWTVTWEYYDGSSYQTLSNVTDNTSGLTVAGLNRVSWDFPAVDLWPQSTLHSISGYWVRAHVTAFTSLTVAPLGTQAWYETGRWWLVEADIDDTEEKSYDVGLGVTPVTGSTVSASIAVSADDAYVEATDTVYPAASGTAVNIAGDDVWTTKRLSGGTYTTQEALLRFDTSSIPNHSAVTAASLVCTGQATADEDARNLIFEWFTWEDAATSDYHSTAQSTAHTGTDMTALTTLGPHTFTLQNLHQISRTGYTGLRAHISGGAPAGSNRFSITSFDQDSSSACQLNITYTSEPAFHYYIPHQSGYTVSDAAALELDDNFEIRLAGYFDMSTGSNNNIISKGTAFILREGDTNPGQLELVVNNTLIGATPLTDGLHEIVVTQGVTGSNNLRIFVDGAEALDASAAYTVTDNATDWTLAQNNVFTAIEYVEWEPAQATQYTHQMRDLPDHQLDDQTGNGFDVTTRYPDTITGYTSTVQTTSPATSIEQAEAVPLADFLAGADSRDITTAPTTSNGFFLLDIVQDVSADTGFPFQAITTMMAIGFLIALVLLVGAAFKTALAVFIAFIFGLVALSFMGFLPEWMAWVFPIPGLFFLIWKTARA